MTTLDKALAKIEDLNLRSEVSAMLLKLQMLAEGPATSLEPSVSHGKIEGSPPKGTLLDRDTNKAPPEDRSLWEHYSYRFGIAAMSNNEIELGRLLILADRAYRDTVKRPNADRIEIQRVRDENRDIQLLLEHGEGIHAAILSADYQWPIGWVRIVRQRSGLDPDYGRPRPRWGGLDKDARYELCEYLQGEGMSQREAAHHLGVSKKSVQNYWHREEVA